MTAVTVEITATRGSAPRDAGTAMVVHADHVSGTIGGGALEHRAIATARRLLRTAESNLEETVPLGPDLGQCCGGSVRLRYSRGAGVVDRPLRRPISCDLLPASPIAPLWVWGAGHVGRAVVGLAAPLGAFDLTWIDTGADRFPDTVPPNVTQIPVPDMPRLAAHAPQNAHHLIFSYSHEIDLALCAALLVRGFATCGLIGSATKKYRFFKRLEAAGLCPDAITCPIGDPAQGKHPDRIAHSTLTALLKTARLAEDSAREQRTARA